MTEESANQLVQKLYHWIDKVVIGKFHKNIYIITSVNKIQDIENSEEYFVMIGFKENQYPYGTMLENIEKFRAKYSLLLPESY